MARQGELTFPPRSEAILSDLHAKGAPLSPAKVTASLSAVGRSDDRRTVTATLDCLLKQRHVLRPARGRYLAVWSGSDFEWEFKSAARRNRNRLAHRLRRGLGQTL